LCWRQYIVIKWISMIGLHVCWWCLICPPRCHGLLKYVHINSKAGQTKRASPCDGSRHYIYIYIYNVKVKWSHYRSGVAQRVGRDISLLFHDRVTRKAEWSTTRHGRTLPSGKTLLPFTHYVCFFCLLTAVHFYQNCCVVFFQASIGVRQKYRNVLKYTQNKEAQNEASCEGLGLASMLRTCKETSNEPLTFRKNLIK